MTYSRSFLGKLILTPTIAVLLLWIVIPLSLTIYYSFQNYNMLDGSPTGYTGWMNYEFFIFDEAFYDAILNTFLIVLSLLLITVFLGFLFASLLNSDIFLSNFIKLLYISPFLIIPSVSALLWKNLMMDPINGFGTFILNILNFEGIDFLNEYPLGSIITMLSWTWVPFSTLLILTSLKSIDKTIIESAKIDGANHFQISLFIILPNILRSINIIILIETIFFLAVFAEISIATNGGPGTETTNLPFLIFQKGLQNFDVGESSAGGLIAVVIANFVAIFLIKNMSKNI
tara:strand:+ start:1037 stop:1900 length:864 start_codon:yes stop_codon:yes gene_type:complete